MPADSFAEQTAPHEETITPLDDFLRQLRAVSDEMNEITQTPEACEQYFPKYEKIMSAAININLSCHRIAARMDATRVQRRLVEIK